MPLKFAAGVNKIWLPSVPTVPVPEVDTVAMVNESPSASVSLASASIVICPESSVVDAVSLDATGAALETATTVIVRLAVSVKKSLEPLVVPSSVMV